jgi:hypothetical protein
MIILLSDSMFGPNTIDDLNMAKIGGELRKPKIIKNMVMSI